jgi:hypothetical protein
MQRMQRMQSTVQAKLDELQIAYEDKVRTLIAENGRQQENNELRAECAELHQAKGLLDCIKTRAPRTSPRNDSRWRSRRLSGTTIVSAKWAEVAC